HLDAVRPGDRVLIVDDLLATGGTATAACQLVEDAGGVVAGVGFLIELSFLDGRKKLGERPVFSLLEYGADE
ncbi:MAG: adenine phosphoribosyltransferase, partial [Gemmatimonadetes bacterium]|nr:adenine phosphoribosyltransferase [Gemmatimonadota bacterium]